MAGDHAMNNTPRRRRALLFGIGIVHRLAFLTGSSRPWSASIMRTCASSLVVAALVLAAACGDEGGPASPAPTATPTPIPALSAEQLTGVYDSDGGVVIVTGQGRELRLVFGLLREATTSVSGTFMDDGSVMLSGSASHEDTGSSHVTGHVVGSRSDAGFRITGELDDAFFGGSTRTVDAFRPLGGTPPVFTGRYVFRFAKSLSGTEGASTAVIDVEVPADGRGHSLAAADELDDAGVRIGTFAPGECVVSSRGNMECRFPHHGLAGGGPFGGPSDFDAFLHGTIVVAGTDVTGAGGLNVTNQAPIVDHAFAFTTWTATVEPRS